MTKLTTPEETVRELLTRVPSFEAARTASESYISHDDDSPYLLYGDFARFLTELILDRSGVPDKAGVLNESFKLLSELATSADNEIANIAVVGVFEVLADCPDCVALAKKLLTKEATKVFDQVLRGWV